MTDKQKNILKAALILFAEQGYAATSTSKVAKEAGVSEGLIFRHFENKKGLLNAIMVLAKASANREYAGVLSNTNPKEVIRGIIEMPFNISEDQYLLWKLIYTIKWQSETYDHSLSAPVKKALVDAFDQLGYDNPIAEAETILLLIDGIATAVLLRKPENQNAILESILNKYNV